MLERKLISFEIIYSFLKNFRRTKATSTTNSSTVNTSSADASTVNVPSDHIVTALPPLSEPLKDLPPIQYAKPRTEQRRTQVTTLSNGLRVASEPRFGQFCTIGGIIGSIRSIDIFLILSFSHISVVIDSGPRYEIAYPSGVSHFLEKLAFHVSSLKHRLNCCFCNFY